MSNLPQKTDDTLAIMTNENMSAIKYFTDMMLENTKIEAQNKLEICKLETNAKIELNKNNVNFLTKKTNFAFVVEIVYLLLFVGMFFGIIHYFTSASDVVKTLISAMFGVFISKFSGLNFFKKSDKSTD